MTPQELKLFNFVSESLKIINATRKEGIALRKERTQLKRAIKRAKRDLR